MKHRIAIGLALIVGGVLAPVAQDALYVDPQGNTNVVGDLDVGGSIDAQGNATVGGTMSVGTNLDVTGSIGQLRASTPIGLFRGQSPHTFVDPDWTPLASGQLDYRGGSYLLFQWQYSLFQHQGAAIVDARIVLRYQAPDGSTVTEYVPDAAGWKHVTNEYYSHHHKSMSYARGALPAIGLWDITFEARELPESPASFVQFDQNDTMTVTVLELP